MQKKTKIALIILCTVIVVLAGVLILIIKPSGNEPDGSHGGNFRNPRDGDIYNVGPQQFKDRCCSNNPPHTNNRGDNHGRIDALIKALGEGCPHIGNRVPEKYTGDYTANN